MDNPDLAKLVRLSDTNLALEHAEEDVRDLTVVDASGSDVGHVADLIIDESHKKVRFLVVAAGGFLGIGEKRFWVPVDAISAIEAERVMINTTTDQVKSAPVYDPEIVPSHPYVNDVYAYYGIAPYWGAGYVYPPYPYIMGGPGNMV